VSQGDPEHWENRSRGNSRSTRRGEKKCEERWAEEVEGDEEEERAKDLEEGEKEVCC